jgi:hypothetical protein
VVLEVPADAGQVLPDGDAEPPELGLVADPDCMSTLGVWIAPRDRTTAEPARTLRGSPRRRNSTPVARVPVRATRVTSASVSTVRFGRGSTGWT